MEKYELIKEIAVKHGIALDRDDPILILHTLNEQLQIENQASQRKILKEFSSQLEMLSHTWGSDAKSQAEKILNATLTASKAAIERIIEDGGKSATEKIEKRIDTKIKEINSTIKHTKIYSFINLLSSALVFVAAIVVLLAR